MNGFPAEEIYGMAVHYYDEDSLKGSGKDYKCQIVVDRAIELTEEEIAEAKQQAKDKVMSDYRAKMHQPKKVNKETVKPEQGSLF